MQRRIGLLVTKIKKRSGNNESAANVTDDEIIDSINDAQEHLQDIIIGAFGERLFRTTYQFSLESNVFEYDFPSDIYDQHIIMFQFTTVANPQELNWSRIRPIIPQESHLVNGWYIRNNKLVTSYTSGTVRITYAKKLTRVDKRRGVISAISPLTITGYDTDEDLSADDYISIVDKDGTIIDSEIYKTGFNSTSGVISISGSHSGNVGDYVVLGKKSSSHSDLSDRFERYLRSYAVIDTGIYDSSLDVKNESAKLEKFEQDIIDKAFMDHGDILEPAITDI